LGAVFDFTGSGIPRAPRAVDWQAAMRSAAKAKQSCLRPTIDHDAAVTRFFVTTSFDVDTLSKPILDALNRSPV